MAKNKLQHYFPMIRTKAEIMKIIHGNPGLSSKYYQWTPDQQQEFLDFCSGTRGVKMLYDPFSKAILNPEVYQERLEDLLSLLLGTSVEILDTLPNDNSRISDESSLVIMDILVRLKDGSIANVEIQKIGYLFPGERSACYSSDLLLRQYVKVRSKKGKSFSYKDIKNVYTIVLFEHSPEVFHKFPDCFIHTFEQKSDSGLEMNLLQKYIFVPLDIFLKKGHNISTTNRMNAWLTFLASDDPEDIISIIEHFPEFKAIYEQIYTICRNVEEVMGMFSEELKILDQNTVKYMIDLQKEQLDLQREQLDQQKEQLDQQKEQLDQKDQQIQQLLQDIQKLQKEQNINLQKA